MGWRYPPWVLIDGQPMDYDEVNDLFREAVEEMEGRAGEQNWANGAITNRTDLANGAVLEIGLSRQAVDVDLEVGVGTLPGGPAPLATNGVQITNSGDWQLVTTLSVTRTTGNSLLWVLASWQHQKYGTVAQGSMGAQYAIRLDGEVIYESLVGGLDRANDPWGEALAHFSGAFATDMILPVVPGQHTVELVARSPRHPDNVIADATSQFSAVFNRELIVVVGDPQVTAGTGTGVVWTPLAEGDAITAAGINTPFTAITNEFNDLDATAIEKETLNDNHLPSVIIATGEVTIGAGGTRTYVEGAGAGQVAYPGFANNTVANGAWGILQDGAATALSVALSATVDLADADTRGVLVLVNVHVRQLYKDGPPDVATALIYAVFAIQVRDTGGTWRTIGRTERFVDGETDLAATPASIRQVRKDVAIRTLITSADVGATTTVDQVRVVISVQDRNAAAGSVTVVVQEANLTALGLQAGA